jgi:hypothetical protein
LIFRGQPLKIFEKQAPMCTLGVGGKPFERGWAGLAELIIPLGEDLLADLSLRLGGALGEVDPSSLDLALLLRESDKDLLLYPVWACCSAPAAAEAVVSWPN